MNDWSAAIARFHASHCRSVLAITGGGASLIGELLRVPGGSSTILEAVVPYSARALDEWLKKPPDSYCSEATALAMAVVAYQRAVELSDSQNASGIQPLGIGLTASLVSSRPKRGAHRAHLAIQMARSTVCLHLDLTKGARDRSGEERLIVEVALHSLLRSAGLENLPGMPLLTTDVLGTSETVALPLISDVFHHTARLAWSLPEGTVQGKPPGPFAGMLCGSFNPRHHGHTGLRDVAERKLGGPVWYELSLHNVDKPSLDYLTIDRRRAQFTDVPLALTDAPTFLEKSRIFPGTVFVVGADTAERIVAPRYYGGEARMHTALAEIRANRCRFLTAARALDGELLEPGAIAIPPGFEDLFEAIPATEFRDDVSSTELRQE